MKTEQKKHRKNSNRILPGLIFAVFYALILSFLGFLSGSEKDELLQRALFSLMLGGIVSFCVRKCYPVSETDPEISSRRKKAFWILLYVSMFLSVLFTYFPNTIWVFMPIFVILSLFSTPYIGVCCASSLLAGCSIVTGCGSLVFFLYFISGVFAVTIYLPIGKELRFGLPAFLSSLCLLSCEVCGIIITAYNGLDIQLFILPMANALLSLIIIYYAFRVYSSAFIYKYTDLYQTLCDTENEYLLELKESNPKSYMLSIHTAYFCDRVSGALSLDKDVVKCGGYYHELTPSDKEDREAFYDDMGFTVSLREMLDEYKDYSLDPGVSIKRIESAVLIISRTIVMTAMAVFEKDKNAQLDSSKLTDAVFDRFVKRGNFDECDITFADINSMKKIFKEEKLYYDFLR